MRKIFVFTFGLIAVLMIVAACDNSGGGGSSTTLIGPEGGVARSSDGKLTLTFPAGAVSEDTLITIKRLNSGNLPEGVDPADVNSAYELGPDGLMFDEPVGAALELPDKAVQPDGSISFSFSDLLTTSAGGEIEGLENVEMDVDADADTVTVTGELDHFSTMIALSLTVDGFPILVAIIEGVPSVVAPGEKFFPVVQVGQIFLPAAPVALELSPRRHPISVDTVTYIDSSTPNVFPPMGLKVFGEDIPFLVFEPLTLFGDPPNVPGYDIFGRQFVYRCDPAGAGVFEATIIVNGEVNTPDEIVSSRNFFLGPTITAIGKVTKTVKCPADAPTPEPSAEPTPEPSAGPSPSPSPSPMANACSDIHRDYQLMQIITSDPLNEIGFIGNMCNRTVTIIGTSQQITISGGSPFVTVSGPAIDIDGACWFDLFGFGTVAGLPGTRVDFDGTIASGTFNGDMKIGVPGNVMLNCIGVQL